MAQPITGAFIIKINGNAIPVTNGVFTPPRWSVEKVRAGVSIAGEKRVFMAPSFTGDVPHQAGQSIFGLASLQQAEVTIETDTGSIWQMFGASANESGETSEDNGMTRIELLGDDAVEVAP